MKARGAHLHYRFGVDAQAGADIENPLFNLLSALAADGSIQKAARSLDVSYRHLWGSIKQWEETLGAGLVVWVRGQPARLTPFAERLLWAEREARVRMAPHIEALRHELQRALAEALDGSQHVLRVDASHDLALPALQALATARQRLHVDLRFAGSLDALQSLADGRCIVAGFHVPPNVDRDSPYARALRPMLEPGRHKLIACMRRDQGLMLAAGNPQKLHSLIDVVRHRARFADREAGAGTHVLADHLLRAAGLDRADLQVSTTENSHLAAATAVAAGRADVALGLRAAADRCGLDFIPLLREDYHLACLADALEQPAVQALRATLALPAWADTLAAMPGYAPSPEAGQVLSLVRALPWWRFRGARRSRAAADARASVATVSGVPTP
jgi:putative molybdopterin biosynthesis protein